MKHLIFMLSCLLAVPASAAPPQMGPAIDSYIAEGPGSFLKKLLQGSPLAGEPQVASQITTLQQVQDYYGEPQSWEMLADCPLNDRLGTAYYVIYHVSGPLFGYVSYYASSAEQIIVTQFSFHTYASELLPAGASRASDICPAQG